MLCEYAKGCEKHKQALRDGGEDASELVDEVCNNPNTRAFQNCYKSKEAQKPKKPVSALPNVGASGPGIPDLPRVSYGGRF